MANGFKIDNIPFHVIGVALDDIVSAEEDAGGMLRYKSLVSASGHSTIRLWLAKDDEQQKGAVRQALRDLGCASEQSELSRLVAGDVPPSVPYEKVRALLDEYEELGALEYEEACLGFL